MGFYEDLRDDTVGPLLAEYGQFAVLNYSEEPTSTSSGPVANGEVMLVSGSCLFEEYNDRDIDGTVIQRGDRRMLLALDDKTIVPTTAHTITAGGQEYSIQNVGTLAPGGIAIMYTLQVRR